MRYERIGAILTWIAVGAATGLGQLTGSAEAHESGESFGPVCLEGNIMVADAMNAPFSESTGGGQVLEVNIFTGRTGVAFENPFTEANQDGEMCPFGTICPGPFKPTGVLSGGVNGHALFASAAQHALVEFDRDGTPLRSVKLPYDDDARFGTVPRLLGTQEMPDGRVVQTLCDANFLNAPNSDQNADGSNRSNNFFPPVYSTPKRARNSRLLVLDPDTLRTVSEITRPRRGELGHDLWGCPAGIIFSDEGMWVSFFHSAVVMVIDWQDTWQLPWPKSFWGWRRHKRQSRRGSPAKVLRIIDFRPGTPPDDPSRRDSLRAITLDSKGNLYATDRARSRDCLEGEVPGVAGGCNPSVFRQRVSVVAAGDSEPTRTLALDPGVNVIAGLRVGRMSAPGCAAVDPDGVDDFACGHETLYVGASAFNPGCDRPGGNPANPCFVPGGAIGEYELDPDFADDPDHCSGDPQGDNSGCARPIATFLGEDNGSVDIDPRMLMTIHGPFRQ